MRLLISAGASRHIDNRNGEPGLYSNVPLL